MQVEWWALSLWDHACLVSCGSSCFLTRVEILKQLKHLLKLFGLLTCTPALIVSRVTWIRGTWKLVSISVEASLIGGDACQFIVGVFVVENYRQFKIYTISRNSQQNIFLLLVFASRKAQIDQIVQVCDIVNSYGKMLTLLSFWVGIRDFFVDISHVFTLYFLIPYQVSN